MVLKEDPYLEVSLGVDPGVVVLAVGPEVGPRDDLASRVPWALMAGPWGFLQATSVACSVLYLPFAPERVLSP